VSDTRPDAPHDGEPTADSRAVLERELTRLMRRARAASARIAADVHPDLDAAAYAVLVAIVDLAAASSGGVHAGLVAETVGLHKSTMSRNLGQLERLGLIERVPDPADARARLLRLTPVGEESVERSRRGRRERLAGQLGDWSDADLRRLGSLLGRLNDSIA
jgi:DNA-binding MarR family transcriptional regulator